MSVTVSIFPPSICHEVMGPDSMILVFWMLSFNSVLILQIKKPQGKQVLSLEEA